MTLTMEKIAQKIGDSSLHKFTTNFVRILNNLQENDEEISFAVLNALEHLILSDILSIEEQRIFMDAPENHTSIARVRRLNGFVDSCLERTFSQQIIQGHLSKQFLNLNNPLFHPYLERFDSLAREETALLKISSKDKVLFIGGGAFPITAIHYAKKTGCLVHCVEKLSDRKEIAETVIAALGMEKQVKILLAEGQKVDCSSYDAIVVGVLAIPKKEIIQQIITAAKPDVRIICRTTIGVREMLCAPLKPEETLSLKEIGRAIGTANQTLTSLLFAK